MGRHIVLFLIIFAGACELPPLPKDIYIESRFTDLETEALLEKIEETNQDMGIDLLGYPILIYKGRYDDPNGFDADGSDFGDDKHVIYKLPVDSDAYCWLSSASGRGFGGYATIQDVMMILNLDKVAALQTEIDDLLDDSDYGTNQKKQERVEELQGERDSIIAQFKRVTLHEYGHHIGLSHNPDECTLMYAGPKKVMSFQPGDKEAFCFVRGCDYP